MIITLCPTYGRPALLQSMLAMYEAQTLPVERRHLIMLDDSGLLPGPVIEGHGWTLLSNDIKVPTLVQKYQVMTTWAKQRWPEHDSYALMDDDDIYAPWYLFAHEKALEQSGFSHPRRVWSTYLSAAAPSLELSDRRFWASTAFRRDFFEEIGGWQDSPQVQYDQDHMTRMYAVEAPGRPDAIRPPAYIYGWGRSNHCSGLAREEWYTDHAPMTFDRVDRIVPKLDPQATELLEYIEMKLGNCLA